MKFSKGQSGNPSGRPKNTGHRQLLFSELVTPHRKEIVSKCIGMALEGNEAMLRVLLERLLPTIPKDDPVPFDLPEGNIDGNSLPSVTLDVLRKIESQELTPSQAESLLKAIASHRDNFLVKELCENLHIIKENNKSS
jgi:hypothetical protein